MSNIQRSHIHKDRMFSFLTNVRYRKFNLWPSVTENGIANILLKEINKIKENGKVFVSNQSGEITSLLAVNMLDWDTKHYGFRCAKIDYLLTNRMLCSTVVEKSLKEVLIKFREYCYDRSIKFVYASVDTFDPIANLSLQKAGFRFMLTWLDGIFQSDNKIPKIREEVDIGVIRPNEVDFFKKIASLYYFKGGRFYLDQNFERKLVDDMYASLISSSFKNDYIMLVCRIKTNPVGIFICKKIISYKDFSSLLVAPLKFLVVDPAFRNENVGYNLFVKILDYLKEKCDLIITEVDSTNLPSINLHTKLGFRFNYTHNIYHWWNH